MLSKSVDRLMIQHQCPSECAQGAGLPRNGGKTGMVETDLQTAGNSWAAPAAHQVNWESLPLEPPCVKLYIANTDVSNYSQYTEKHLFVSWFMPSWQLSTLQPLAPICPLPFHHGRIGRRVKNKPCRLR